MTPASVIAEHSPFPSSAGRHERSYVPLVALAAGLAIASTPLGLMAGANPSHAGISPPSIASSAQSAHASASPTASSASDAASEAKAPATIPSPFDRIDWRRLIQGRVLDPARTAMLDLRDRFAMAAATATFIADAGQTLRSALAQLSPIEAEPAPTPWFGPRRSAGTTHARSLPHAAARVHASAGHAQPAAAWLAPIEPPLRRISRSESVPVDVLR